MKNGTSPGKDVIKRLMEKHAPCVILIDELVAYIRQFPETGSISGGSYDTNLSFVHSLTEATKLVPNAIVLASLPESEVEAGSQRGVMALSAMEKTFGRVQAPLETCSYPKRLLKSFDDGFLTRYAMKKPEMPLVEHLLIFTSPREPRCPPKPRNPHYYDRLVQAYPIHPEVFDRLYEDWTTLEGFQRTRGVLKLMAKVIYRLWQDQNSDCLILPGSLPLYDGGSRNELVYYLGAGWDAVLEKDIDGERAETTELESREPRFGAVSAARRAARTVFLGSAPSAGGTKKGTRGIDRGRILLGCLQPAQTASTFVDALNRLADRLHYLNSSGDKAQDSTRFWFDVRANLRREMEDRKGRFDDKNEVIGKIASLLKKTTTGVLGFDGTHIFTPHGDVPDDGSLRLVMLPPKSGLFPGRSVQGIRGRN